jgi:hypothetical protein
VDMMDCRESGLYRSAVGHSASIRFRNIACHPRFGLSDIWEIPSVRISRSLKGRSVRFDFRSLQDQENTVLFSRI